MITTELDHVNFTNSIEMILQEFIQAYMDVYVAFDYKDVQKGYERMNDGRMERKPVIHLSSTKPSQSPVTLVTDDNKKGRKIYVMFSVFTVVNENTDSSKKIKTLLNEISDELKHTFDKHRSELYMFNNVNMSLSEAEFSGNPDNLYACKQTLTFDVIKEI